MTERSAFGDIFLATLAGISAYAVFTTSFSPASWAVVALCAWLGVATLRGWRDLDVWEQRLMLWALFSIISFTHFLLSDPSFRGWASVFFYCGDAFEYCTPSFRWNMRGWRKATALWNFCLSTALAFQRLGVEAGLGGLLPGEEVITRESFMAIGWRLIPFWLNRWESTFGAECSSILFELPHFAVELLVVLPLVQIVCGRLRIVGQPHVRAGHNAQDQQQQQRRMEPENGRQRGREDAQMVPNVLMCAWVRDSSQRRLLPRLKANIRVMAMIVLVTTVAAFNALVVPLALERNAAFAPRSQHVLDFSSELRTVVETGHQADVQQLYLEHLPRSVKAEDAKHTDLRKPMYPRATACLLRSNCTSPLQNSLAAALKNHGAFKHMSTPSKGLEYVEVDAQAVLVPPHWVLPLLEEIDNAANLAKEEKGITLNAEKIALLLTPGPSTLVSEVRKSRNGKQSAGTDDGAEVSSLDAVRHMQRIYLSKAIARRKASNATTGARPVVLSRLYRNLYKHSSELYRMRDPKHSALVPLVEAALTIMRLSCERWFGLVGVYVGYLIFLDPPPVARKLITVVARLSRVFQRGILLSFPAVCWAYGAGMVFSSFASVIFWTGPVLRAVEQLRSVATEVQPQEWHPATPQELDRMGSSCAICWGSLTAAPGDGAPASMPTDAAQGHGAIGGGVNASAQGPVQPIGGVRGASAAMGLPCSHAYHRQCLLEWLQACYSQSRTAICPMCQVEVPLQVRYRVPLTTGGPPGANAGADGGGGGRGDGGAVGEGVLHRRERGIPGLDALVEVLHEDFQHRFEQPIGPLHFAAEGGEVEVAQAEGQQEGPPPDAPPLVAAVAHGGDEADANDTAVGANNSPAANVSRREQEEVMLGSSEQVQVAGSGSGAGGALPVEGDRPRERRRRGLLHRLFNRRRPRIQ